MELKLEEWSGYVVENGDLEDFINRKLNLVPGWFNTADSEELDTDCVLEFNAPSNKDCSHPGIITEQVENILHAYEHKSPCPTHKLRFIIAYLSLCGFIKPGNYLVRVVV